MRKNYKMTSLELLTLVYLLYICSSIAKEVVPGSGEFQITGIFPITNANKTAINFQTGVMMQAAMEYAIQKINKLNDSYYLYGYQLVSSKIPFGATESAQINTEGNYPTEFLVREGVLQSFTRGVPFIIGPYSSELAYISSILTGTFQLVSITYGASYSKFIDFGPNRGFMFRTIPSDTHRMKALMELLKKLKWNYVSVVASSGYDGEKESKDFIPLLPTIGVCLAGLYDLNNKNYGEVVEKLKIDKRLKAIIMFTTNEDSKGIISQLRKGDDGKAFLLICVYGCTNYIEVVRNIEKEAEGVLSLNLKPPDLPDFKNFFLNLKPNEKTSEYFNKSWEQMFRCSVREPSCRNNTLTEGRDFYTGTPVHTVITAVSVIAETLRIIIENVCTKDKHWMQMQSRCVIDPESPQMWMQHVYNIMKDNLYDDGTLLFSSLLIPGNYLKRVSYEISHFLYLNNTYQNIPVGTWEYTKNDYKEVFSFAPNHKWYLNNGSYGKEEAVCSRPCPIGHISEKDINPQTEKCCWNCVKCPQNNIVINDTCIKCQETETANIFLNSCVPLTVRFIELKGNPAPAFIIMMSIVGLCFIIVVIAFFVKYNSYRLVRASGRDLCYMILFGLSVMFSLPFFFLGVPSVSTCLMRSGLPGVSFLTVYAPLFLKTNRIYRIFCHAKKSVSRPSLVSSRSLLLLSFGIVTVQILLVGVWFISKVPVPIVKVSKDFNYVTMHCRGDSSPVLLLLNVALNVGFIISCTVLAFKTRHFPKNYNEAKVIGITLYITCVAWSIFLPVYFLIPEIDFVREYFMSSICIIIGYITLFGLFGQKIWLLMCQKNLENENGNLPTWYLSYSDCKENGDATVFRPEENVSSDETIA